MKKLLLLLFLSIPLQVSAQISSGFELQVYPAGVVTGAYLDIRLPANLTLTSRIGYNFTNRKDWGKHENEEGGGPGFSLGIEKKSFLTNNLSVNLRADLWFMDIDWTDPASGPALCGALPCPDETGTTEITVFQPTIGLGYLLPIPGKLNIKPTLSFGYEINIETEGEDVGEGAILLLGFKLGYPF